MAEQRILSRDWVHEAKDQYKDKLHAIETDLGECMQECCRRDVKNQVYSQKMKERLREYDPSSNSQRVQAEVRQLQEARGGAVQCCNLHPAQATAAAHTGDGSVLHVDTERDERMLHEESDLQQLRQQRAAQIKRRQAAQDAAAAAGYGHLTDVSTSDTLQEVLSDSKSVVVHLWEAGIAQELDEHLTLCALEYLGTRFVRTPASRCKQWIRQQQYPQGPQLLAVRAGRVLAGVRIGELQLGRVGARRVAGDGHCSDESSDFGSDDGDDSSPSIKEHDVRMWLKSMNILHRSIKASSFGGKSTADAVESESEGEESERVAVELDWRQPCRICGRTYPHEHKRAVRASSLGDAKSSYIDEGKSRVHALRSAVK